MRRLAVTLMATLAASCASSSGYVLSRSAIADFASPELQQALKVSRSGITYERVRGEALGRLVVGSKMWDDPSQAEPVVTGAGSIHFRQDGTYFVISSGRIRTTLRGTYEVHRDWVCMYPGNGVGSYCFGLFDGQRGRHLAVYPKPYLAYSVVMIARDEAEFD